jgi:hypothetical protein
MSSIDSHIPGYQGVYSAIMDYTSARKPITIDRESESSWYTQTITRKALSSIPDQFKKMPKFETLKFSHRKGFGPTVLANGTYRRDL